MLEMFDRFQILAQDNQEYILGYEKKPAFLRVKFMGPGS